MNHYHKYSKLARIGIGIAIILTLILGFTYRQTNAQSDIAVQLITSGTTYVYEKYYSYDGVTGDPNISIDIPCEVVRDKERQTVFVMGAVNFPDNDGSGTISIRGIPSRGEDWSAILYDFPGTPSNIPLVSLYAFPIYPKCKMRLEWTNPGTVKWKVVLYTRAIVN